MSNKIRLIRIYELRGKVHPIEAFMIDILDGLEEVDSGNQITYIKDYERYFDYFIVTKTFYMYPVLFLESLRDICDCHDNEIMEIIKYLSEKYLKIKINLVR